MEDDGWMDGWTEGWMDGRIWMDGGPEDHGQAPLPTTGIWFDRKGRINNVHTKIYANVHSSFIGNAPKLENHPNAHQRATGPNYLHPYEERMVSNPNMKLLTTQLRRCLEAVVLVDKVWVPCSGAVCATF